MQQTIDMLTNIAVDAVANGRYEEATLLHTEIARLYALVSP